MTGKKIFTSFLRAIKTTAEVWKALLFSPFMKTKHSSGIVIAFYRRANKNSREKGLKVGRGRRVPNFWRQEDNATLLKMQMLSWKSLLAFMVWVHFYTRKPFSFVEFLFVVDSYQPLMYLHLHCFNFELLEKIIPQENLFFLFPLPCHLIWRIALISKQARKITPTPSKIEARAWQLSRLSLYYHPTWSP